MKMYGTQLTAYHTPRIISEDDSSPGRFRRSLLAAPVNQTSVTLEFGNPPAMNISVASPPSIEEEIEMAREVNDSVDLQVKSFEGLHVCMAAISV